MRLLYQNPKTGEMKLLPTEPEDLWHLYNVIERGDIVSAYTFRRMEARDDTIRADKEERVRVFVVLEVERTEFTDSQGMLRITGRVREGISPAGSYHTINITEGVEITIRKERWPEHILQRIREALEGKKNARLIAVAVEYGEAVVAVIRSFGVQEVATVSGTSAKEGEGNENSFYEEVVKVVRTLPRLPIIVVGPGFIKEDFVKKARELEPKLFSRAQLIQTGQGGMQGIREAMAKPENASVMEGLRMAEEARLMEELKREIARGGKYAYGRDEVRNAASAGAVRALLVCDINLREGEMKDIVSSAEQSGAEVHVLTTRWDPGKELQSLGGIAALLRYIPQRQ